MAPIPTYLTRITWNEDNWRRPSRRAHRASLLKAIRSDEKAESDRSQSDVGTDIRHGDFPHLRQVQLTTVRIPRS